VAPQDDQSAAVGTADGLALVADVPLEAASSTLPRFTSLNTQKCVSICIQKCFPPVASVFLLTCTPSLQARGSCARHPCSEASLCMFRGISLHVQGHHSACSVKPRHSRVWSQCSELHVSYRVVLTASLTPAALWALQMHIDVKPGDSSQQTSAGAMAMTLMWSQRFDHPIFSSPVVAKRASVDPWAIVSTIHAVVYALGVKNGQQFWRISLTGQVFSDLSISGLPGDCALTKGATFAHAITHISLQFPVHAKLWGTVVWGCHFGKFKTSSKQVRNKFKAGAPILTCVNHWMVA
jgi:hypothetical protein